MQVRFLPGVFVEVAPFCKHWHFPANWADLPRWDLSQLIAGESDALTIPPPPPAIHPRCQMPKKIADKGVSIQGYFRPIFQQNPKLLKQRSNEPLYERWLRDHPGEKEVPERVRQGLSNLESVLPAKQRGRGRRPREAPDAAG